jgi:tight adherence protein B
VNLIVIKYAAVALCAAAGAAALVLAARPGSTPERAWQRYAEHNERALRGLFLSLPVKHLALAQLGAAILCALAALALRSPRLLFVFALVALGPPLALWAFKRVRLAKIEASLDTLVLSLSNALRTTPSIGNALANVQELVQPPLSQELALTLREMRLGTSLDRALLNMAERIQSVKLDAAISSLLIARQVGGDVAQTLATTAQGLREMGRLEGVVRSKTAACRAQLWLLAFFPAIIVFLFDTVKHGYFTPLAASVLGWAIVACAVTLWAASIFIARKVLSVEL